MNVRDSLLGGLELYDRREMLRAILTWNCRAEWKAPAPGALQSMKGCRTDLSSSASRSLETPTGSGSSLWAWNTVQHSLMRWPHICVKQERQRRTSIFKIECRAKNLKRRREEVRTLPMQRQFIINHEWRFELCITHGLINYLCPGSFRVQTSCLLLLSGYLVTKINYLLLNIILQCTVQ